MFALPSNGGIGSFSFGSVYKAKWRGTEVAVKIMPSQHRSMKEMVKNFNDEVSRFFHCSSVWFYSDLVRPYFLDSRNDGAATSKCGALHGSIDSAR